MDDIKYEEDLIQRQKKEKKDLTGTLNMFFLFFMQILMSDILQESNLFD